MEHRQPIETSIKSHMKRIEGTPRERRNGDIVCDTRITKSYHVP